jgi:hypothetical protein
VFIHRLGSATAPMKTGSIAPAALIFSSPRSILWDPRYLERAVLTLRQAAVDVPDELLAHLSPLDWEHVNLTGDYVWGGQHSMSENTSGLRALRTPQEVFATAS